MVVDVEIASEPEDDVDVNFESTQAEPSDRKRTESN
jgi:hypothetical protein